MKRLVRRLGTVGWIVLVASRVFAAPAFELKDGDRVVLIGGTFIEREQTYGYLETLLTSRFPDRAVTFRNLGWSGDTVWGEARARFGKAPEGFAHLKEHVESLKPTVIFVNYGLNESFAGKAGLPAFETGLNTLLDVLDKTGARVVLITPRRLENLGPPLPDPARANERLADYVGVLRQAAAKRSYRLVDLFNDWKPIRAWELTDNGLHLTAEGYREAAVAIATSLGLWTSPPNLTIDPKGHAEKISACHVEGVKLTSTGVSLQLIRERLPLPALPPRDPGPADLVEAGRRMAIRFEGFSRGEYALRSTGGDAVDFTIPFVPPLRYPGKAEPRDDFDLIADSPADLAQAEALRATIVAKNELYFYRWRPQNETYLFGFRKYEQGNNAIEIPRFDPIVAAREAEIARLRVPAPRTFEIVRKDHGR